MTSAWALPARPSPARPVVVAVVGTDVHPFDRLVTWVDEWAADHPDVEVIQQVGSSRLPRVSRGVAFLAHDELTALLARATIAITHGGPATIADVREAGRFPIVVPRDPELDEHVDGHQQRYAAHLGATGRARVIQHRGELHYQLDLGLAHPERFRCEPGARPTEAAVARFGELVATLAPRRTG